MKAGLRTCITLACVLYVHAVLPSYAHGVHKHMYMYMYKAFNVRDVAATHHLLRLCRWPETFDAVPCVTEQA